MENSTIEIFFASGDFVQWAIIILLFKNSKIIFMSLKNEKIFGCSQHLSHKGAKNHV
jgi:hypothetical protein